MFDIKLVIEKRARFDLNIENPFKIEFSENSNFTRVGIYIYIYIVANTVAIYLQALINPI